MDTVSEDLEIIEVIPASSVQNPNLTRTPLPVKTEAETENVDTAANVQPESSSSDETRDSLEKLRDELKEHLATLDDK
jgi:hypothetical protein